MNPPVTAAQLSSAKSGARPEDSDILTIAFDDNRALSLLCGGHDENLALIEHRLAVEITPRGNRLAVRGLQANRDAARDVLTSLYSRARRGLEIARGDVEEMEISKLSLMPEGVEKQLQPQELIDLFALLKLDKPPTDPQAKPLPNFSELK